MNKYYFLILSVVFSLNYIYPQSGTFDFLSGYTQDGQSISQTVSGVKLTIFSDHTITPYPSMTVEDWSAYPPFTNDAATMNGQAKPSLTFIFDHQFKIVSLLVADFDGVTNYHLKFTPDTGPSYDVTIDGINGSVVHVNFPNINSFVVTNYNGGNICLGVDNIVMMAPLPVELSSLSAITNKNVVNLRWKTETEVNNNGFSIERRGQKTEWHSISFLKGNGNSNKPTFYSYTDKSPVAGNSQYRLKQIDNNGLSKYYGPVDVTSESTLFELNQNYPNPFNPSTIISYQLPVSGFVSLKVYDILGKEVSVLTNGYKPAGKYTVTFNASSLASGILAEQDSQIPNLSLSSFASAVSIASRVCFSTSVSSKSSSLRCSFPFLTSISSVWEVGVRFCMKSPHPSGAVKKER